MPYRVYCYILISKETPQAEHYFKLEVGFHPLKDSENTAIFGVFPFLIAIATLFIFVRADFQRWTEHRL